MTETDLKIIKLLSEEKHPSLDMLKKLTGLNNYQLSLKLSSLKNKGFLIERIYFSDTIRYCLHKDPNSKPYIHMHVRKKFRFLAIADTHIGSINERFDLLDNIYEYAAKVGIHTIVHCGDLIEGPELNDINSLKKTNEVLKYIIKKYPKDDNIYNYITFGNHDARSIVQDNYNIINLLTSRRLDFISMGYKFGCFKTLNDFITIYHPYRHKNRDQYINDVHNNYPDIETKLILLGHTHRSASYMNDKSILINVPCLCSSNKPGAWDITINYDTSIGQMEDIILRKIDVEPFANITDELYQNVKKKEFNYQNMM